MSHGDVHVSVCLLPDGQKKPFSISSTASLLAVMQRGALESQAELLPDGNHPLDQMRNIQKHHVPGPPLQNLAQPIGEFLENKDNTNDFGIDLLRVFRVNTRWAVAPQPQMSPHQILDLLGLPYQDYTLYRPEDSEPLPLETAIAIQRGDAFEAQRDGRYGEGG